MPLFPRNCSPWLEYRARHTEGRWRAGRQLPYDWRHVADGTAGFTSAHRPERKSVNHYCQPVYSGPLGLHGQRPRKQGDSVYFQCADWYGLAARFAVEWWQRRREKCYGYRFGLLSSTRSRDV